MLHRFASERILLATLLALAACSPKPPGAPPAPEPPSTVAGDTRPALGAFLNGGSREVLVNYLRTVRETPATTFEVEWNVDVVKIDRETAIATLQAVSADGVEFRFTADAPALRDLAPGRILFLWGIALRRITAMRTDAGVLVVTTAPVSLPEVFKEANIDFKYRLDATQAYASLYLTPPPRSALQLRAPGNDAAPRAMPALFISDARADELPSNGPKVIELPNSFTMNVNGIDIELAYQPIEGGLHFDIEARKQQSDVQASTKSNPRGDIEAFDKGQRARTVQDIKDARPKSDIEQRGAANEQARGAAGDWKKAADAGPNAPNQALVKGLFGVGSDLLDLRLKASGDLTGISTSDSLTVSNHLQIHGGALGLLKTEFRNVKGKLKLQVIARRGEKSEQWIEKLKIDVPIRFNIPVIVAGLPMIFQVGFNVIAQPALTTKNDTFDAEYEIPFSGSGNVSLEGDKFTVGGTLAAAPNPLKTLASSIGVSAILVALQAPRVGLGVGVFGASSVVYIDLVSSATLTSGGALGLVSCRQFQLVTSINGGVDTQIAFDLPGLAKLLQGPLSTQLKKAGNAASLREQIFKKEWYRVEPDAPICRTG